MLWEMLLPSGGNQGQIRQGNNNKLLRQLAVFCANFHYMICDNIPLFAQLVHAGLIVSCKWSRVFHWKRAKLIYSNGCSEEDRILPQTVERDKLNL